MGLTDLSVRKIKPKKHRFEILDGNGLYIRIGPTGRKSWVFRYNFESTARRLTLGSYPTLSLAEARERHALAFQDVEKGIDPGLKSQQVKAKHKAEPTFQDLLNEKIIDYLKTYGYCFVCKDRKPIGIITPLRILKYLMKATQSVQY